MRLVDIEPFENHLQEIYDNLSNSPQSAPMKIITMGYLKRLKSLPTVDTEQRWIPVTERLPDEDYCLRLGRHFSVDVLMTVCNSNDDEWICELGHTINGEWYSEVYDEYIEEPRKVIAWMPMPELYAERRTDETD